MDCGIGGEGLFEESEMFVSIENSGIGWMYE